MSNNNFLLKVLGLATGPRIITAVLNLICYPIMVKSVGASEIGIVIFVTSVVAILESFVDFGVSSAAGKELAIARVNRKETLRYELKDWAKMQILTAFLGLIPFVVITYIIIVSTNTIVFDSYIFSFIVASVWITIASNFCRASLTSLLDFKRLAILDTFQSVFRSLTYLFVAFIMPTAMGLVIVGFFTAITTSILSVLLLLKHIKNTFPDKDFEKNQTSFYSNKKKMITESLNFLWLRIVTRSFDSLPLVIFGKLFGSEVVGIVGVASKIIELVTFPFAIIGNALSVKANEVIHNGIEAIKSLWNTVSRLMVISLPISFLIFLESDLISFYLLPGSQIAVPIISILSILVITTIISRFSPMSDYVGGLGKRNILLTTMCLFEIPIIWLGSKLNGVNGGVLAYILILIIMNIGYLRISLNMFFQKEKYFIKKEIVQFVVLSFLVFSISLFIKNILYVEFPTTGVLTIQIVSLCIFITLMIIGILINKRLRSFYFTKNFLEF